MLQAGQKVICINAMHQYGPLPCVVKDEIYVVRGIRTSTGGVYVKGIFLEVFSNGEERGFFRFRFMEIDEEFAERALENVVSEIEADAETLQCNV